jgi:hypothetical protein
MSDDTTPSRRKSPTKRDLALQAIAAYRSELAAQYEADLAAWSTRRQAEIAQVRKRLNQPGWHPRTPWALENVGQPPKNPLSAPFWSYQLP